MARTHSIAAKPQNKYSTNSRTIMHRCFYTVIQTRSRCLMNLCKRCPLTRHLYMYG